jgi:glutathione synthase/RimK-type ligase-like ATP-grasp enzyme
MRVLVTTSRMPFALEAIRKLGEAGHMVFAADTFRTAPGSHSRYVEQAYLVPPPRFEPAAFVRRVHEIVAEADIDLIVPAFEEVFYLTRLHPDLESPARVFTSPFETLRQLHDKAALLRLAAAVGVPAPPTEVVESQAALASAVRRRTGYFARPAYSRGGVDLLTDTGPLAGEVALESCTPTPENPWLVQPFVEGRDICSLSVVHRGQIAAHCAYVHPRTIEHAGGIVFESVDGAETLAPTAALARATHFTGHLHLDWMATADGLQLVECNPRPTAGLALMEADQYADAIIDPLPEDTSMVPPGRRLKISVALLRDMLLNWREAPEDLNALLSDAPDLYGRAEDPLPGLYQFLSYSHVLSYRWQVPLSARRRSDLLAAQFHDVEWDGAEITAE